jgi:hypothetical protein
MQFDSLEQDIVAQIYILHCFVGDLDYAYCQPSYNPSLDLLLYHLLGK